MNIIKYFFEEPASLEVMTPDLVPEARGAAEPVSLEAFLRAPQYFRGYLAGTDLRAGHTGATALSRPEAFIEPLLHAFPYETWTSGSTNGRAVPLSLGDVLHVLRDPSSTRILACGDFPDAGMLLAAAGPEHRRRLPALRRVLRHVPLVLLPESAPHGFDWALFSTRPMREPLTAAFRRFPREDVRRFVIPYREARSEEKFYFERYDLAKYEAYEIR
ncbi:hypothetical protein [Rhodocaloribacter sp.]